MIKKIVAIIFASMLATPTLHLGAVNNDEAAENTTHKRYYHGPYVGPWAIDFYWKKQPPTTKNKNVNNNDENTEKKYPHLDTE